MPSMMGLSSERRTLRRRSESYRPSLLAACLAVSLCGCFGRDKKPQDTNNGTENNNGQQNSGSQDSNFDDTLYAVSVPTVTETTKHDDGTVVFEYTYQHMSLVHNKPEVADKIILDFLNRVDSTRTQAESIAQSAKSAYGGTSNNWISYLYHLAYSPTRIDNKVLSLFGNNVVFTGAGHPERTCVSASYDMLTGDILTLASIMAKDAKADDFCNLVLETLAAKEKELYLYKAYKDTVKQRFATDSSTDEMWYFNQNGLCFYFAPYEIAPYSSGVVTVDIPYAKLTNLLHEAYLPASRPNAQGMVSISPFDAINLEEFSHIAELVTSNDGQMHMATPQGTVYDVSISYYGDTGNYTIFTANILAEGNGIAIKATDEQLAKMKMTYKSGTETITIPLVK